MVASERKWFPTEVKAEQFWMKVIIEKDGQLKVLEI
jgi:hypothetical protein